MPYEHDPVVQIPQWARRQRADARPRAKRQTLSERLRQVTGEATPVIDQKELEQDLERLRPH